MGSLQQQHRHLLYSLPSNKCLFLTYFDNYNESTKIKTVANKEVIGIIWSLKNKSGMEGSFALELSNGLTGSTHCAIDHPNQNVKTLALNRFLQEIYDFMK